MNSQIVDFYSNSNVLITGGTGCFGKVLIQKLLRTCHDIRAVYLIVRMKKGIPANQRYKEIFQDALFETLEREQPDFLEKVHVLEGDCSLPNLGLSKYSVNLLTEKINVVFHCAATLNFNEALRVAVVTNVRSLQELLQLSYGMVNLKAFIYVSTTYSNCTQELIEERFYDLPIKPATLINLVDELNDKILESVTEGLIQPRPNTYCYTKAVAENLLLMERKNLPVAIFRPSIVTSTYTDPIPGWTSNLYGSNGIIYFIAQGILRTMKSDWYINHDMVPVDMAVNALICSAWETNHTHVHNRSTNIKIYNYCAGLKKSYNLVEILNMGRDYPHLLGKKLWYPFLVLTTSPLLYTILWFLLQTLPAHVVDLILHVRGERLRMVRLNGQIGRFVIALDHFTSNQFEIQQENVTQLWNRLKRNDQELFPFNIEMWDKDKYNKDYIAGLQLYIGKEPFGDPIKCSRRHKRLQITHYISVGLLGPIIAWLLYKILALF